MNSRRGTSLLSAVVSMGIIAACLVMVLQTYVQGRRFVAVQACRLQAGAAAQEQIERARAAGYSRLTVGERGFGVADAPNLRGALSVTPGPTAGSKAVTARVTWPADERLPAGQLEMATIITARGLTP